jgi:hypothetical protein
MKFEIVPQDDAPSKPVVSQSIEDVRRDFFDARLQLKTQSEAVNRRGRRFRPADLPK